MSPPTSKASCASGGPFTSALLRSLPPDDRAAVVETLSPGERKVVEAEWPGMAHEGQWPRRDDWRTWLFLGGRGAGKTRAGAEWLSLRAFDPGARLALVGPTLHDVREVMIEGPSGLASIAPRWRRPVYSPARRQLTWPNGATAQAFSAEDPDALRGPQFHAGWADEFCAWRDPEHTLAMLRLGLRLGEDPRLVVTTTPRPIAALRRLMEEQPTETTRAATTVNAHNLAPGFVDGLRALYGGTRLAAQEMEGLVVEAGGLWPPEILARCRGRAPEPARREAVVVGLDPPASRSGACGVVVATRCAGRAYVLDDRTVAGRSPRDWAETVARAVRDHGADEVVAEVNQGGDMVPEMLRLAGCAARVRTVHARRSKRVRAEPVAALYEQGRVIHCGDFPRLEEELMALGAEAAPARSPDRADALVWAVSHLLLAGGEGPRVRRL